MRSPESDHPSLSFLQLLLAALPFTKANKELRDTLDNVNNQSFYDNESKRVFELKNLVKEGKHEEALSSLLSETNVENPLQYFNKIRCDENPQAFKGFRACSPVQKVEDEVRKMRYPGS